MTDFDILKKFEDSAFDFIFINMTTFTQSLSAIFAVILTAYFVYKIIFTALYGGEVMQDLLMTAALAMLASIFAQTDMLIEWIIDPFMALRDDMTNVFTLGGDSTWDVISVGMRQAQVIMKDDSWFGVDFAGLFYGGMMMISLLILYITYAGVYLGAAISFLCVACFSGVVLQLAALPPFRGMLKSYVQALAKYTLICVVAALIINLGIYIMGQSIESEMINKDGFIGQSFFVIIITCWITIGLIPKAAEIVADLIGGSMSDVAGDAKKGLQAVKEGGGLNPVASAGMQTFKQGKMMGAGIASAMKGMNK